MAKDKTVELVISKIKDCMGSDSKVKPGYPFKLKDIATALEKDQEIVLKTVISSGAGIQKDAGQLPRPIEVGACKKLWLTSLSTSGTTLRWSRHP